VISAILPPFDRLSAFYRDRFRGSLFHASGPRTWNLRSLHRTARHGSSWHNTDRWSARGIGKWNPCAGRAD